MKISLKQIAIYSLIGMASISGMCYAIKYHVPAGFGAGDVVYNQNAKTITFKNVTAYCQPVTPPKGTVIGQYLNPNHTGGHRMGGQSKTCTIYYNKPFVGGVVAPKGTFVSGVKTPSNLPQDEQ